MHNNLHFHRLQEGIYKASKLSVRELKKKPYEIESVSPIGYSWLKEEKEFCLPTKFEQANPP